ncbi:MAG: hypothetical protein WBZ00_01190 [Solirubrobacterales bacterium]
MRTVGFFGAKRTRTGWNVKAGRTMGGIFKTRKGGGGWVFRTKKKK